MRLSIRARLLFFSLLLILTGVNLTAGLALYIQIHTLEENHEHFGEELAEIVGQNIQDPLYNLEVHKLNRQLQSLSTNDDIVLTLILDPQGTVLADGSDQNLLQEEQIPELLPTLQQMEQQQTDISIWSRNNDIAITHRIVTPFDQFLGYIHLELSRDDIEKATGTMLEKFLMVELLLLAFSIIAALLLSNFFHRPLKEAVATANRIASGDYSSTLPHHREDEFGELSNALHQMSVQIENTINALHGTQQELEEIFRSMVDGVVVINRSGTILKVNQRMEELCNELGTELIGLPLEQLFGEEIHDDAFSEIGSRQTLYSQDGNKRITVQVNGALIHPPYQSEPSGSVLIIHDLRDQLRAESQEQYAAFQAGIAEMGASVLHNIGNVITGMSGHLLRIQSSARILKKLPTALQEFAAESDRIAQESESAEELGKRLQETSAVLDKTAQSMEKLNQHFGEEGGMKKLEHSIRHIGDIISIQQSASRPVITATRFNMQQLVGDTHNLIDDRFGKYNIEWSTTIDSTIPSVNLPRNPLMQLLLNLLKNSLEAIIEEMLENDELIGMINLNIHAHSSDTMRIIVSDNGCGMTPEQTEQVFTARYTTKKSGSGYGLHSASNFIHQLGGEVHAESDGRHQGCRLIITLPYEVHEQEEENTSV